MRGCLARGNGDGFEPAMHAFMYPLLPTALSPPHMARPLFGEQWLAARTVEGPADHPSHAVAWVSDFSEDRPVASRLLSGLSLQASGLPMPSEVWLWLGKPCPVRGIAGWEGNLAWLNRQEAARTRRFRFVEDRWSYSTAHAALRLMVGALIDCPTRAITFSTTDMGKPVLCAERHGVPLANALQFNISHTRGMVAVALSGSPVGVDVERVRPLADMRQLVADLMAREALEAYDAAADAEERAALFFRYWTLGEAFIKATGQGLDQGLSSFAFSADGPPVLTRVTPGWGEPARWRMVHACCERRTHPLAWG